MNPLTLQENPDSVLAVYIKLPGPKMDYAAALAMGGLIKEQIMSALDQRQLLLPIRPQDKLVISAIVEVFRDKLKVPPELRACQEASRNFIVAARKELEFRKSMPGMDGDKIREDENRLSIMEANQIAGQEKLASLESLVVMSQNFLNRMADSGAVFLLPRDGWCILIAYVVSMAPALVVVKDSLVRASLLEFSEIAHGDSELNDFRTFHPVGFCEPFQRHFASFGDSLMTILVMLAKLLRPGGPSEPPNRLVK